MDGDDRLAPRSPNGFTLIEILIALVLISVGLLSLASISLSVLHANRFASRVTHATALAQDRLEILKKTPFASLASGSASTGPPDQITLAWTVTEPQTGLKQVTLTATWTDSSGQVRSTTFGTLVSNP